MYRSSEAISPTISIVLPSIILFHCWLKGKSRLILLLLTNRDSIFRNARVQFWLILTRHANRTFGESLTFFLQLVVVLTALTSAVWVLFSISSTMLACARRGSQTLPDHVHIFVSVTEPSCAVILNQRSCVKFVCN